MIPTLYQRKNFFAKYRRGVNVNFSINVYDCRSIHLLHRDLHNIEMQAPLYRRFADCFLESSLRHSVSERLSLRAKQRNFPSNIQGNAFQKTAHSRRFLLRESHPCRKRVYHRWTWKFYSSNRPDFFSHHKAFSAVIQLPQALPRQQKRWIMTGVRVPQLTKLQIDHREKDCDKHVMVVVPLQFRVHSA